MEALLIMVLAMPIAGGITLALVGHLPRARDVNALFSLGTLLAALALTSGVVENGPFLAVGNWFFVDPLNVFLVTLTAFVGFTTSLFSRPYMQVEVDRGKMTPRRMRLYHSMYQFFNAMMLLALTTNNLGIMWVAMEAATLTTVLLVSVYRTAASLEAAWKYFILCGVGIAQALFGTIVVYLAAENAIGAADALTWTRLAETRHLLDPNIMAIAFAFLLLGYGTKVGLVVTRPRMSAMVWVPAFWAAWPTAKKMPDLMSAWTVMCSSPAKFAIVPPMPKAKVIRPMCSIDE